MLEKSDKEFTGEEATKNVVEDGGGVGMNSLSVLMLIVELC